MFELILGKCNSCHSQLINKYWCKGCRTKHFLERFSIWTSENYDLDNFIQESQLNAREEHGYFRWYNYGIFENIQLIGYNKGFSEVYYATIKYDESIAINGDKFPVPKYLDTPDPNIPGEIILKRIVNSGYMVKEFIHGIKNYFVCMDETILKCYGITRDPYSKDYMLVLQYANMKSLNDPNTLMEFSSSLSWAEKKELFKTIVQAIKLFHESNLIHQNLHLGSILLNETYSGSKKIYISDIEMCNSTSKHSKQKQQQQTTTTTSSSKIFGVMPFLAPEILKGENQTKYSNIYSLGMIFWCIISGQLPYTQFSHDSFLAYEICNGKMPIIPKGTPKDFIEIIKQCWESDPFKRPSIQSIAFDLNWSVISDGESIDYNSDDFCQNSNAIYSRRLIDFNFKSFNQIKPYC